MRVPALSLGLLLLTACDDKPDTASPDVDADADGDGFIETEDCDDHDAAIFPGAEEACDSADNDCDGEIDEGVTTTWHLDADGDGFGNPDWGEDACAAASGWVADATDCDDLDPTVHPHAAEACNDIDDDCDGDIDEDVTGLWYADADGDGYGDPDTTSETCDAGEGWVDDDSDCDDGDAATNPGADESCNDIDDDCDGAIDDEDDSVSDAETWYLDTDGDGYGLDDSTTTACEQPSGHAALAGDCDDDDDAYNPGADESDCTDPADYNCDGSTGYDDDDGDGWAACEECDDSDAAIHPDATELCDEVDNDCDGVVDEDDAGDAATWYADTDGDGFGDAATTTTACEAPSDHVADSSDCDDGDAGINPGASETCNGVDDDCDSAVDGDDADITDTTSWYADADGDGYGDAATSQEACSQPDDTVTDDSDCDDDDAAVNPGASETCNGVDDDCDGLVDDEDSGVTGTTTWWLDYDHDGYGADAITAEACEQPSGYVDAALGEDCDDLDASAHPGAGELCDGTDNDCDGETDEDDASDTSTWYADSDGDGYGDASTTTDACAQPSDHVADAGDCDDGDATINPGATELCDASDNDCDGTTDEDDATDATTWYADDDGDGYGDAADTTMACSQPEDHVVDATDCDDGDDDIHPAHAELCDG